ncbi:MAG: RNA polymerase sigma factor [Candidatus Ancillula sp.]|jgi:RNA polymerase sigma-70 factor (ECF subfamily)|nr:RNA polymerase sigma factor [Candidatus Ancillula sp.]
MKPREYFDELLEPIAGNLYNFLRKYATNDFDCDIIFQSTIMRAYKKFDQFTPGTNFKAWIFKIAYRVFLNYTRSKKQLPKLVYGSNVDDIDLHTPDTLQDLENDEVEIDENVDFNELYNLLTKKQQEIIYYYYAKSMKYKEIAKELNIPIGTVMSRLNRAKAQIRKQTRN